MLSMTEDKLAEAEQAGLHKKFKLESTISTSNMVNYLGNKYTDNVILTQKLTILACAVCCPIIFLAM